jgi:hypothetical protein
MPRIGMTTPTAIVLPGVMFPSLDEEKFSVVEFVLAMSDKARMERG